MRTHCQGVVCPPPSRTHLLFSSAEVLGPLSFCLGEGMEEKEGETTGLRSRDSKKQMALPSGVTSQLWLAIAIAY